MWKTEVGHAKQKSGRAMSAGRPVMGKKMTKVAIAKIDSFVAGRGGGRLNRFKIDFL